MSNNKKYTLLTLALFLVGFGLYYITNTQNQSNTPPESAQKNKNSVNEKTKTSTKSKSTQVKQPRKEALKTENLTPNNNKTQQKNQTMTSKDYEIINEHLQKSNILTRSQQRSIMAFIRGRSVNNTTTLYEKVAKILTKNAQNKRNNQTAISLLKGAVELSPNAQRYRLLAQLYDDLGDYEKARQYFYYVQQYQLAQLSPGDRPDKAKKGKRRSNDTPANNTIKRTPPTDTGTRVGGPAEKQKKKRGQNSADGEATPSQATPESIARAEQKLETLFGKRRSIRFLLSDKVQKLVPVIIDTLENEGRYPVSSRITKKTADMDYIVRNLLRTIKHNVRQNGLSNNWGDREISQAWNSSMTNVGRRGVLNMHVATVAYINGYDNPNETVSYGSTYKTLPYQYTAATMKYWRPIHRNIGSQFYME